MISLARLSAVAAAMMILTGSLIVAGVRTLIG
jgi:hypothetical protein